MRSNKDHKMEKMIKMIIAAGMVATLHLTMTQTILPIGMSKSTTFTVNGETFTVNGDWSDSSFGDESGTFLGDESGTLRNLETSMVCPRRNARASVSDSASITPFDSFPEPSIPSNLNFAIGPIFLIGCELISHNEKSKAGRERGASIIGCILKSNTLWGNFASLGKKGIRWLKRYAVIARGDSRLPRGIKSIAAGGVA